MDKVKIILFTVRFKKIDKYPSARICLICKGKEQPTPNY